MVVQECILDEPVPNSFSFILGPFWGPIRNKLFNDVADGHQHSTKAFREGSFAPNLTYGTWNASSLCKTLFSISKQIKRRIKFGTKKELFFYRVCAPWNFWKNSLSFLNDRYH